MDVRAALSGNEEIARCRRLFEPALRAAVSRLHPWSARMAAFSLGWTDTDGRPYPGNAGKGVRPAVALLTAEGAGAPAESAVPAAVAVELVHAFSLIHDDIIDHDEQRRHRPALWKAYGEGPALLAGDALLALAIAQLAGAGDAMRYLSYALVELVQGQTADIAFEDRPWDGPGAVTPDEYTEMAAGKTGALLGAAAAAGVVLGGAPDLAPGMWAMGRELGVAFQIADDVLGIWGDPGITGKPADSDLRRGKKTYPILAALAADGPASRELADLLTARPADDHTVSRAARLAELAGGRAEAEAQAARHLSTALDLLSSALPHASALTAVCHSLIGRMH